MKTAIRDERARESRVESMAAIWVAKKSTLMFHRRRRRRRRRRRQCRRRRHWRQIVYNNGHSVWEEEQRDRRGGRGTDWAEATVTVQQKICTPTPKFIYQWIKTPSSKVKERHKQGTRRHNTQLRTRTVRMTSRDWWWIQQTTKTDYGWRCLIVVLYK